MESKIDILQIRNAENAYAAINGISEKVSDFIFEFNIEKEDLEILMDIAEKISKIEDRLFDKAQTICKDYILQNKGIAI